MYFNYQLGRLSYLCNLIACRSKHNLGVCLKKSLNEACRCFPLTGNFITVECKLKHRRYMYSHRSKGLWNRLSLSNTQWCSYKPHHICRTDFLQYTENAVISLSTWICGAFIGWKLVPLATDAIKNTWLQAWFNRKQQICGIFLIILNQCNKISLYNNDLTYVARKYQVMIFGNVLNHKAAN